MEYTAERAGHLEENTIQPIPLDQRHGSSRDLFTIWFGTNIMLLTIVTGALAVTVFSQPFWWAVAATVIGNLVGAVFMALHSAQGPQLGVPQMIQTRGQFGAQGSLLVVGLVVIMYLGFFASNVVIGGQALHSIMPVLTTNNGIIVVGLFSLAAAIYGYDLIHAYTRWLTYGAGLVLLLAFCQLFFVHGVPADFFVKNSPGAVGFMGVVSISALWQLAYAPYVSDYSRYMPADTGSRAAFWSSYWGCALGSILPMILGAAVGLCVADGNIVDGLYALTGRFGGLVILVFALGIAASNAMNLYCGALSVITIGQTAFPAWQAKAGARTIAALGLFILALSLAIFGQDNFLVNYTNFILLLLYVLVPWTAINLVDYYFIQHGVYDVASFFRRDGGIYGRYNQVAIASYLAGIAVQLPFVVTPFYTGPIARLSGGADISWIVGLAVTAPLYYLASRFQKQSRRLAKSN